MGLALGSSRMRPALAASCLSCSLASLVQDSLAKTHSIMSSVLLAILSSSRVQPAASSPLKHSLHPARRVVSSRCAHPAVPLGCLQPASSLPLARRLHLARCLGSARRVRASASCSQLGIRLIPAPRMPLALQLRMPLAWQHACLLPHACRLEFDSSQLLACRALAAPRSACLAARSPPASCLQLGIRLSQLVRAASVVYSHC